MLTVGAHPAKHMVPEAWTVSGRVAGIAGPGVNKIAGRGFAVSRTGTGVYVLTFDKHFPKFEGGAATVMSASLGRGAQVSAYSIANQTITITVITTNSNAATDLGTSDELWFSFDFGNSQVSG